MCLHNKCSWVPFLHSTNSTLISLSLPPLSLARGEGVMEYCKFSICCDLHIHTRFPVTSIWLSSFHPGCSLLFGRVWLASSCISRKPFSPLTAHLRLSKKGNVSFLDIPAISVVAYIMLYLLSTRLFIYQHSIPADHVFLLHQPTPRTVLLPCLSTWLPLPLPLFPYLPSPSPFAPFPPPCPSPPRSVHRRSFIPLNSSQFLYTSHFSCRITCINKLAHDMKILEENVDAAAVPIKMMFNNS